MMFTMRGRSFSILNLRRSHSSSFEFDCSNYLALFSTFKCLFFAVVSFNILLDCSIRVAVTLSLVCVIQCTSSQLCSRLTILFISFIS